MVSSPLLDSRHRLIDCLELFRGTIDGASVRELCTPCVARGPAGHPWPSFARHTLTFSQRASKPVFTHARS